MSRFQISLLVIATALGGVFVFMAWQNSLALTAVSIRVKEGVQEHTDHSIGVIGSEHRLPDYKVKIRIARRLLAVDLGTRLNTSATNWINFPINDLVPLRKLQEVIIVEDDRAEDDVLARIQGTGTDWSGSEFACRLSTFRSFETGMDWFFDTALGKAIVTAIVLAIILVIARFFRLSDLLP